MVVALAITTDGRKVPVGLYEGDTENTTVVTALLADLADRGLDTTGGVLFVLDGAKALTKAVRKVFGSATLIQRCTLHKRRNVADHLPEREKELVDRKLVRAVTHPDPELGPRAARELAASLAPGPDWEALVAAAAEHPAATVREHQPAGCTPQCSASSRRQAAARSAR